MSDEESCCRGDYRRTSGCFSVTAALLVPRMCFPLLSIDPFPISRLSRYIPGGVYIRPIGLQDGRIRGNTAPGCHINGVRHESYLPSKHCCQ